MRNMLCKLCLTGALLWLSPCGRTTAAVAADDRGPGPGDRFQRLEQRVNELAERQEQLMRRLGSAGDRQERLMPAGPPTLENARRPWVAGAPHVPVLAKVCKGLQGVLGMVFLVAIVFNILLAIWIFTDIRKRGEGSGIFIALALVAGIPAALIYTLVRIGDKKP